jgi:hypothetical protein
MKNLYVRMVLLGLIMFSISSTRCMTNNSNVSQPEQMSWISWFKSYIPGTREYSARRLINSMESTRRKIGSLIVFMDQEEPFYKECDELINYLIDPKTSQMRLDIVFNETVSNWRKKLIEILKTWEKGKNENDSYIKDVRQNMYKHVMAAIEKVKKDSKKLTNEQLNFLGVVQESLYNRIVKNI